MYFRMIQNMPFHATPYITALTNLPHHHTDKLNNHQDTYITNPFNFIINLCFSTKKSTTSINQQQQQQTKIEHAIANTTALHASALQQEQQR